jgi:DNA-binding NarL/FixJ family response regulator
MREVPQSRGPAVPYSGTVLRLVIVDDHPAIVDAVRRRAADESDLLVVGSAATLEDAMGIVRAEDPDVVLCDLQLAGEGGGLELLATLAGSGRPAVVILSAFEGPSLIRGAFERGAAGYLPKSADLDTIIRAIRDVAAGRSAFPASTLRAIRAAPRPPSAREVQVLDGLAEGATNAEIGGRLAISEKTVESHLRRMFDRYGVLSRTELTVLALREGWLRDPGADGRP